MSKWLAPESVARLQKLMAFVGLIFFLSPYLLLVADFGFQSPLLIENENFWPEFGWALKNSFYQSFLSALLSVLMGMWLALGLNRLSLKWPKLFPVLQGLLLAPVLLPPFFILLTFMSWVNPFPFGIPGIVFLHLLLLSGLAAVMLRSLLNDKLGELAEVAEVLGSRRRVFLRAIFPLVRRELISVFAFLFIWSFTSFSIPFVVGGGRGTTLEILIYERVRIAGDFGGAVLISGLQTLLLALFLYFQFSAQGLRMRRQVVGALLTSGSGMWLGFALALSFVLPWVLLSYPGFEFIFKTPGFMAAALVALLQSVKFAILVGVCTLALLSLMSFLFDVPWFAKFFALYYPASLALVGLAGLGLGQFFDYRVFYVLGLLLLFTPSLFRLGLDSSILSLREQMEIAKVLGASPLESFWNVQLPQIWPRICLLSGLAFLWTLGDFALAKFFFESGETLPLLIENLMSSYRVDPALSLGYLILGSGALGFFVFWRLGRVFDP